MLYNEACCPRCCTSSIIEPGRFCLFREWQLDFSLMVVSSQQQSARSTGPPTPRWLAAWWSKTASFLAILSLIDVTHQVVEWATFIHAIVSRYVAIRELLFGWLPFHVPQEWHNYVILACVTLSVSNIGFYRATGKILPFALSRMIFSPIKGGSPLLDSDQTSPELFYIVSVSELAAAGASLIVIMCSIVGASGRSPTKRLSMVKRPARAGGRRLSLQLVWFGSAYRSVLGCAHRGLGGEVERRQGGV